MLILEGDRATPADVVSHWHRALSSCPKINFPLPCRTFHIGLQYAGNEAKCAKRKDCRIRTILGIRDIDVDALLMKIRCPCSKPICHYVRSLIGLLYFADREPGEEPRVAAARVRLVAACCREPLVAQRVASCQQGKRGHGE